MELKRSSGILLHITSLPGPFGTGDLGPAAYDFINFLHSSGHKYWQILPLNPTDEEFGFSPYSSHSAFAGNPLLISPQLLEDDGLLDLKDFPFRIEFPEEKAYFPSAKKFREEILEEAFSRFKRKKVLRSHFKDFCDQQSFWLEDFALFMALRKKFRNAKWIAWPPEIRDRHQKKLEELRQDLGQYIEREKFHQYIFFSQWERLRAYGRKKKVRFLGDLPFYISHDSVDCWTFPEYFKLDQNKNPIKVAGVPPDYFSETGQLWGNPVFNWKKLQEKEFDWWIRRIDQNLKLVDLLRLDHFRAFSAAWEVKAGERTAANGKWVKTPGMAFFRLLKEQFPHMPFIAEDLGTLDPGVFRLLHKFGFPGMKVLQFAFGDEIANNPYIPFNYLPNNVVYTGTHDNNTTLGWYKKATKTERKNLDYYSGKKVNSGNVSQILVATAIKSVAAVSIIPFQDILGIGEEGIMNVPGTTKGNWTWRFAENSLTIAKVAEFREMNEFYGRRGKEEE